MVIKEISVLLLLGVFIVTVLLSILLTSEHGLVLFETRIIITVFADRLTAAGSKH